MKAILSKSATGNIRSKILDPKYKTAEIILEVEISPQEFAELVSKYDEREFEFTLSDAKADRS